MDSWGRSACYPQGSFYPLSDGNSRQGDGSPVFSHYNTEDKGRQGDEDKGKTRGRFSRLLPTQGTQGDATQGDGSPVFSHYIYITRKKFYRKTQ